jgi:HD-GYP domain-containing protein (c-di-GMP phosphodiesterase class II)
VNATSIQSETIRDRPPFAGARANGDLSALDARLQSAGISLLACDETGQVRERRPAGEDVLIDVACASPLFRLALREAAARWSVQAEPECVEIIPGLWLSPMVMTSRRRRCGYAVAMIATEDLVGSEQLSAMCQAAGVDVEMAQRTLVSRAVSRDGVQRVLPRAVDVPRLVALVRCVHEDFVRMSGSDEAMESVGRQLAESYEEMSLLYSVIANMTVQEKPERFVAVVSQELLATLPYSWIGTQLSSAGSARGKLKSLAGRLIAAGDVPSGSSMAEVREAARTLLGMVRPGESMVIEPGRNAAHASLSALGSMVIAHPIVAGGEVIGVLMAGDKRGADTAASSVDTKLLGATASHMAIFMENAALYEDLGAMFLGTLEALTASIDAKDRYTCGHSRRVAHLTQQLAAAIGLDEHAVSRCHIAGLVHDVGKIGVPEAVLLKPGRLDAQEFAWIRRHPEMGHRILKDIPQLADVLPGVLYHHERWDGKGYPQGLRREEIPLIARLIGLADSFDAMSSSRTYRSALPRAEVLREIERCAGSQFDPELARAFVRLDFSEFDRLVQEHQAREFGAVAGAGVSVGAGAMAPTSISISREEAA